MAVGRSPPPPPPRPLLQTNLAAELEGEADVVQAPPHSAHLLELGKAHARLRQLWRQRIHLCTYVVMVGGGGVKEGGDTQGPSRAG
jgi:hypothetical protein